MSDDSQQKKGREDNRKEGEKKQRGEVPGKEESKAYGADDLFEEQAVPGTATNATSPAMMAAHIMTKEFQDVPPFQPFALLTGFRRISFQWNTCERNIYYDDRTASGTAHFLLNELLLGGLLMGGVHFTTWAT